MYPFLRSPHLLFLNYKCNHWIESKRCGIQSILTPPLILNSPLGYSSQQLPQLAKHVDILHPLLGLPFPSSAAWRMASYSSHLSLKVSFSGRHARMHQGGSRLSCLGWHSAPHAGLWQLSSQHSVMLAALSPSSRLWAPKRLRWCFILSLQSLLHCLAFSR